jgi:hypothetical protein
MKTNLQFFLNSYADLVPTTVPSQNNFKWLREINGIPFNIENDQQIQVLPSVTTPNIVPYPFSAITNSGSYSINGTPLLVVFGSPVGIAIDQLIVGPSIPVGTTVLSIAPIQYNFTVSGSNATAGAVYSSNGLNFTVSGTIVSGSLLVSTGGATPPSAPGTLTLVSGTGDATIAFSGFTNVTNVTMSQAATNTTNEEILFYQPAAFIYFESDQQVSVIYNNGTAMALNPFQVNGVTQPAVFFMAGPCYSLSVTNMSATTANLFFASMG